MASAGISEGGDAIDAGPSLDDAADTGDTTPEGGDEAATPDADADDAEADAGTGDTGAEDADPDAEGEPDAEDTDGTGEAADDEPPVQSEGKDRGKKKDGPIPLDRHEKIIKNIRAEYEDPKTGKYTAVVNELTGLARLVTGARTVGDGLSEVKARVRAFDMAQTNPEEFAKRIVKDPKIAKFLVLRGEEGVLTPSSKPASKAGDRPKPNAIVRDSEGKAVVDPDTNEPVRYYDDKGLEALSDWLEARADERAETAAEKVRRELKDEYDTKYGPIYDREKATELFAEEVQGQRELIAYARDNWEDFVPNEPAIQALVLSPEGAKLTLFDAYRKIVVGGYKAKTAKKDTDLRKRHLSDLNRKTKAAQPAVPGHPAPVLHEESGGSSDELTRTIMGAVRRSGLNK